jgi:hypothetical protein
MTDAKQRWDGYVVFDGVLLAKSDHDGVACGIYYTHQVAMYRVDRVVRGHYTSPTIIVDHPACGGDVFTGIAIGDRVRVRTRSTSDYGVITYWPTIREVDAPVERFYVATRKVEPLT